MKKWTTALILSGMIALSIPAFVNTNITAEAQTSVITNTLKDTNLSSGSVTISNSRLKDKLKSILNLSSADELKADSLINSTIFNNSDSSKNLKSLDLSSTGITDITELRQFIWPKDLVAINLADNGITAEDFSKIKMFESYKSGDAIQISSKNETYTIYASGTQLDSENLSGTVSLKSINLMFNDIDLEQISSDLSTTKYLFGLQGTSLWDENNLVLSSEIDKVKYYFNSSQIGIMITGTLKKNGITVPAFTCGEITTLLDSDDLGSVDFSFSDSSYYNGWNFKKSYKVIDVYLSNPIAIERGEIFCLPDKNLVANPSNQVSTEIKGNPNTSKVGSYTFYIKARYGNLYRDIKFEYHVVDTTAPIIVYSGENIVDFSKNKEEDFNYFQNINTKDNNDTINETKIVHTTLSEDEVLASNYKTPNIIIAVTNLDFTTLSQGTPYFIKYFCTDESGNSAESITRYVNIVEHALDSLILRCNTKETITGNEIILEVKPESDIDMSKYSGYTFEYKWYVDGKNMGTTTGDFNAKSTQTFTFDSIGMKEIKVELTATKEGSQKILLTSNTLYLEISAKVDNTQIILISFAVAVLLIIIFFSVRVIIKVRRSKKNITQKSSTSSLKSNNTHSVSNSTRPSITIIQGVNPRNQGSGGNVNTRPPENDGSDKV